MKKQDPTSYRIIDFLRIQLQSGILFDNITVQDLYQSLGISNNTFYARFHDKYEVRDDLIQQFHIQQFNNDPLSYTPEILIDEIFQFNHKNRTMLLAVWSSPRTRRETQLLQDKHFFHLLQSVIRQQLVRDHLSMTDQNIALMAQFFLCGFRDYLIFLLKNPQVSLDSNTFISIFYGLYQTFAIPVVA